jgi:ribosomal protein S17E
MEKQIRNQPIKTLQRMIKHKLINKVRPNRFHNPNKPLIIQLFKAKSKKVEIIKMVPGTIKRLRKAKQKKKTKKSPNQ